MFKLKRKQKKEERLSKDKYILGLCSQEYNSPGDHIAAIISELPERFLNKYKEGQEKHGGKLWRKNCLGHLENELIDALIYFKVIDYQHELARQVLLDALGGEISYEDAVDIVYGILTWGNVWGNPSGEEKEEEQEHA
jgi:hypothetical protein